MILKSACEQSSPHLIQTKGFLGAVKEFWIVVSGEKYCQNCHSPGEEQILMGPFTLEFQIHKLNLDSMGDMGSSPQSSQICV